MEEVGGVKESDTSGPFLSPVRHEELPKARSPTPPPMGFFRAHRAAVAELSRAEPWRLEQARHAATLCVLCGGILGQRSRLLSCINDAHKRALAWNNALFDYGPIMCS